MASPAKKIIVQGPARLRAGDRCVEGELVLSLDGLLFSPAEDGAAPFVLGLNELLVATFSDVDLALEFDGDTGEQHRLEGPTMPVLYKTVEATQKVITQRKPLRESDGPKIDRIQATWVEKGSNMAGQLVSSRGAMSFAPSGSLPDDLEPPVCPWPQVTSITLVDQKDPRIVIRGEGIRASFRVSDARARLKGFAKRMNAFNNPFGPDSDAEGAVDLDGATTYLSDLWGIEADNLVSYAVNGVEVSNQAARRGWVGIVDEDVFFGPAEATVPGSLHRLPVNELHVPGEGAQLDTISFARTEVWPRNPDHVYSFWNQVRAILARSAAEAAYEEEEEEEALEENMPEPKAKTRPPPPPDPMRKRRAHRVRCMSEVRLKLGLVGVSRANAVPVEGRLLDLSGEGCGVELDRPEENVNENHPTHRLQDGQEIDIQLCITKPFVVRGSVVMSKKDARSGFWIHGIHMPDQAADVTERVRKLVMELQRRELTFHHPGKQRDL